MPLVGRDREVAHVLDAIRRGERIVTVTGAGGAGKTRLAIEVGSQLGADFADRAVFVALAAVEDADLVPAAIGAALDITDLSGQDAVEQVSAVLRHRRSLLVLDNFEQVLSAGPLIARLLDECSGLVVLVTSRTPVRIRGERVFRLGPLEMPPPPGPGTAPEMLLAPDQLLRFPSVAMFCACARAVWADFSLTSENAEAVVAICRWVDGLPLAIELAAARSNVLTPGALRARMEADGAGVPLSLLDHGSHDAPRRQQSLRATLTWSYELLGDESRVLFRRLAVLHGSWLLETAEAVCADTADDGTPSESRLEADAVLDHLSELVDMHLVEPDPSQDGRARFSLLVTVAAFARELLVASGEHERLERRCAEVFLAFGDEACRGLESADERRWLDLVEFELPNLRVAYAWARSHDDVSAASRLAVALGPYWLHRGHAEEGRRWLEVSLSTSPTELSPVLLATAEMWAARLAAEQGAVGAASAEADETIARTERALEVFDALDDPWSWLRAAEHLAHVLTLHEDTSRAQELTQQALAQCRAERDDWWRAQFLHRAALLAQLRGESVQATVLVRETIAVARATGHERMEVRGLQTLAQLTTDTEGQADPEAPFRENLRECGRIGEMRGVATTLPSLGAVALMQGDVRRAAAWYAHSLRLSRDIGYWHAMGFSVAGTVATLALASELRDAARLHGSLVDKMAVLRRGMPPEYFALYEGLVDRVREGLGRSEFEALVARGETEAWDVVLTDALTLAERLAEGLDPLTERPSDTESPLPRPHRTTKELTVREIEVLRLIAGGLTNREIAGELFVSPKTVMHHSVHIYRKLGVRGRAEATAYAFRHGLLETP
jgi:predicted ATPase/DNA-binding CsgD family transcriptional regulator